MGYNLNAGFGRLLADKLAFGIAGKTILVGKSAIAYRDTYSDLFGVDPDGSARFSATLAGAVSLCTAGASDTIVILPGHTETISSATALTISVSGVQILGLGTGALRPTFTLDTAATATINITAANVTFKNCLFVANFADIASCFTLTTAKDFRIDNCEFRDTSSVLNFLALVDTDTTSNNADGITIVDSAWLGLGATANTCVVKMDGTNNRFQVQRNYFAHAAVTAAAFMPIATGKVVTNLRVLDNIFNFVGATGLTTGMLITTNGSTNSGVIARNFNKNLDATSEILVTASSGFVFFENKSTSVADASGYTLPAADA